MWESVCRLKQGVNPAVRCVVCTYVVCWLVQLVVQERTHPHAQAEGHTEVGSGEEGQRKTERVRARGQEWAPNIKTSLLCLCPHHKNPRNRLFMYESCHFGQICAAAPLFPDSLYRVALVFLSLLILHNS